MKEAAKAGLRSDRRTEKTSALKQGCQQLQRVVRKRLTQISDISDRTTSLKRTQGTTKATGKTALPEVLI